MFHTEVGSQQHFYPLVAYSRQEKLLGVRFQKSFNTLLRWCIEHGSLPNRDMGYLIAAAQNSVYHMGWTTRSSPFYYGHHNMLQN